MKKIALIISVASVAIVSCKKQSPDPPTPDSDLTTSKDAVKSYEVMNDVFLMAALTRDTYTATPFFGTNVHIGKDTVAKVDTLVFLTNAVGTDGSVRTGTILIKYSASTSNAKFIRQPGFKCTVELQNYTVDSKTVSATSISINNTAPVGFNPNTTNLSWSATYSNFTINEGTRSIIVSTTHNIQLTNTNNSSVYNSTGNLPIQWQNATISIGGNGNGSNDKGAFEITFDESNSESNFYRNLVGCSPGGFNKPGKHPFTKGLVYVKPNGKNIQTVNLGQGTCDYNVTITIDGITYQTDVL